MYFSTEGISNKNGLQLIFQNISALWLLLSIQKLVGEPGVPLVPGIFVRDIKGPEHFERHLGYGDLDPRLGLFVVIDKLQFLSKHFDELFDSFCSEVPLKLLDILSFVDDGHDTLGLLFGVLPVHGLLGNLPDSLQNMIAYFHYSRPWEWLNLHQSKTCVSKLVPEFTLILVEGTSYLALSQGRSQTGFKNFFSSSFRILETAPLLWPSVTSALGSVENHSRGRAPRRGITFVSALNIMIIRIWRHRYMCALSSFNIRSNVHEFDNPSLRFLLFSQITLKTVDKVLQERLSKHHEECLLLSFGYYGIQTLNLDLGINIQQWLQQCSKGCFRLSTESSQRRSSPKPKQLQASSFRKATKATFTGQSSRSDPDL